MPFWSESRVPGVVGFKNSRIEGQPMDLMPYVYRKAVDAEVQIMGMVMERVTSDKA